MAGKSALAVGGAFLLAAFAGVGALVVTHSRADTAETRTVDFNRDIRPIFNSRCVACHGGVKQVNGVSFSYREQALGKGKSGRPTVVPGDPNASELMARITSADPNVRMPLHGQPLTTAQIALLRQWIRQGAPWENYWAFVAPKPQALPAVQHKAWVRQPLDRFILAGLEKASLAPAPEADKAELLRRVSLDLTGLPPTPGELAAFLTDTPSDAYEKQVDRLLASPRYGERWASMWLDLARYADSKGLDKDPTRPGVWPYRDWVIGAFNQNMPYDQFMIKQLAGDLLPNPTFGDRIATSFHRQTIANDEGGTDDEEYRLAAAMDRSATTWQVLNGVTMNCVQCHSHPYDPIRHAEYYKFLAFFNTSRDADISNDKSLADDWPVLHVPTDPAKYSQADHVQQQIAQLRDAIVTQSRAAETAESHWQLLPIRQGSVSEILAIERALAELQNRPAHMDKTGGTAKKQAAPNKARAEVKADGAAKALKDRLVIAEQEKAPKAGFRLHDGMAETTGTVPGNSVFEFTADAAMPIMTALRIEVPTADAAVALHSPERGFGVNRIDAWVVQPDGRSEKIAFRVMASDSTAEMEGNFARLIRNSTGSQAVVMQRLADNSGFMADPNLFRTAWVVAVPVRPVSIPAGARLKVQLTQTEGVLSENRSASRVRLSASSDPRWTAFASAPALEKNMADLEQLERQIRKIPTVPLPVMAEEASYEQRATLEFDRGSFLTQIGPELAPDTPAVFPRLPSNAPRNRLTMAKWFFEPGQPLTARVAVNRYWEQLFGAGIVETQENFGSAGDPPSNQPLLDWEALHFQNDLHWNIKALLREIVTSATYRQSARTTPALQQKDPGNRLLAHGPRQRLSAEMVRDQALLASGLLNPEMGGPPVMPQQPDNVWASVAFDYEHWATSPGSEAYRRAVYTYIKRTTIYPSFITFDMADRQSSVPRRIPTNTPLQALVTLNDPVYQQAAEALARRMIREAPHVAGRDVLDARLNFGARCVLSRDLTPAELAALRGLYGHFDNAPGQLKAVASALLNLDAALTR